MHAAVIVVGVDGSTNAQRALEAATDVVTDDGVVHVVTAYRVPSPREMTGVMASIPEEVRKGFDVLDVPRGYLREAEAFLAERGIDHKGHFIAESAAAALLDVADDVSADLIVVGSRGLGRRTRFLHGSVSSRIANHASMSFMVIHDRANADSDSEKTEPIT